MYTHEALLDELDASREQLLVAIEPLPDEALEEKGAVGGWSIVDILVNQTAWEAELVTALMRIKQSKRPDKLLAALKDPAAYDEGRYEENQDRDLDQVFADYQNVRVQLEEWLEDFSERELTNPGRYRWFGGRSLGEVVASVTFEREQRVIPAIEQFAERWLEEEAADQGSNTISLAALQDSLVENENEDEESD